MLRSPFCIAVILALGGVAPTAVAGIDPLSGVDFAHIGAPGNAPWMGNGTIGDTSIGRGSVAYEYNIGRFEVTTAQWAEFMNAAFDRPANDRLTIVNAPAVWGAAAVTPTNAGGRRWVVPAGNEMIPVGGVSWHTCAMYCNWLCNGKSSAFSAFQNGAYDVSTFHQVGNGFTDQLTHNANAQYWIPTLDESLKASHFDPNRFGPGQAGYWIANNTLGHLAANGPPGSGEANYGFGSPSPFSIPLGSYPTVQSAWGLLDLAGAAAEWSEAVGVESGQNVNRGYAGSFWGSDLNARIGDTIYAPFGGTSPSNSGFFLGFRIASSVPAPGAIVLLAGAFAFSGKSRRTRGRWMR